MATAGNEKDSNSRPPPDDVDNTTVGRTIDTNEEREGLAAWLQVLGAFILNLNTWGMMNAYGAFQTFYQLQLLRAQTSSQIAWIGSTQAFLSFLVSIVAGPLFDAGHFRSLMWVGSGLVVVGMFLVSISDQYWQIFLTQAIMMGLGFGCLYLPALAVVSQHFHKNTALAIGTASSGSAIGGVIYPIVFAQLQPRIGFGWATRVIGFILLATCLVPVVFMRSHAPPGPTRGLFDRSAFRDVPYLLLNVGLLFCFMGLYIVLYYIQLFALARTAVPSTLADYLLVIINASSLVGRLVPGYYADRMGSVNVLTAATIINMILTWCLLAVQNSAGLVVFSVLYGCAGGTLLGLPAAGVVSLSANKSKIGTRLGMLLAFVGFGVLISNPVAGAILGGHQNWVGLTVWCAVLLVASSLSMVASRVTKVGRRWMRII